MTLACYASFFNFPIMSYPTSPRPPFSDNQRAYDAFGQRIAARLNKGLDEVHPAISQRLRFAREQAVRKRAALGKKSPTKATGVRGYITVLGYAEQSGTGREDDGNQEWHWAARMALTCAMLLAFGASLVAIEQHAQTNRARELAEVDIAILIDDLPPNAYSDSGFAQYLRIKGN